MKDGRNFNRQDNAFFSWKTLQHVHEGNMPGNIFRCLNERCLKVRQGGASGCFQALEEEGKYPGTF